jgi:hypothetical protein
MPYYGDRLGRSEFNARVDDATWRAGHNLWWAAWNNVPAASLPNDEVALTRFADLGRDVKAFRRIREGALHGFVLCNDDRLYHPFIAELALSAWERRIKEREKKRRWREGKNRDGTASETGTEPGCPPGQDGSRDGSGTVERRGEDRKDSKSSVPNGTGAGAPPQSDPVKELWDRGLRILGEQNRALFAKLRKEHGDPAVLEAIVLCEGEHATDPPAFFVKCLAKRRQRSNGGILPNEGVF